jgi:hypothetical protein
MSKGTYSHSNRHRMHELKQKGDDFCCKNSNLKHWKNMWANQRDDIKLLGDEIVKLRRENEEIKKDEPQGTNHDEVANLKGIIKEPCMYALQENEELEQGNAELMKDNAVLMKDNAELMKDKERLDWLVDNASISMLRKDEDGEEWWVELDYSEPREDIDKEMNQPTQ